MKIITIFFQKFYFEANWMRFTKEVPKNIILFAKIQVEKPKIKYFLGYINRSIVGPEKYVECEILSNNNLIHPSSIECEELCIRNHISVY